MTEQEMLADLDRRAGHNNLYIDWKGLPAGPYMSTDIDVTGEEGLKNLASVHGRYYPADYPYARVQKGRWTTSNSGEDNFQSAVALLRKLYKVLLRSKYPISRIKAHYAYNILYRWDHGEANETNPHRRKQTR